MSYAEAKRKREKIEMKLARAKEREREARLAERNAAKPAEPQPSSQPVVVTFTKTYGRGRQYSYAAIRPGIAAKWFVTGRVQDGKTWDQLMEFAATREASPIWRWEQVRVWYPIDGNLPTRAEVNAGIPAASAPSSPPPLSLPASEYGGYP